MITPQQQAIATITSKCPQFNQLATKTLISQSGETLYLVGATKVFDSHQDWVGAYSLVKPNSPVRCRKVRFLIMFKVSGKETCLQALQVGHDDKVAAIGRQVKYQDNG